MLPKQVYANKKSSKKFEYTQPQNRSDVDEDAARARITYDLMSFMQHGDSNYFLSPDTLEILDLNNSNDEIDTLIVNGAYEEAAQRAEQRLEENPNCEKTKFQSAFIQYLQKEYAPLLEEEPRKTSPKNISALLNKGVALANTEQQEEALNDTNKALLLDPENMQLLKDKAYIAKLLGRDEESDDAITKAQNISAGQRIEMIKAKETKLLRDMNASFMNNIKKCATASIPLIRGAFKQSSTTKK